MNWSITFPVYVHVSCQMAGSQLADPLDEWQINIYQILNLEFRKIISFSFFIAFIYLMFDHLYLVFK